jgi:hypothetical protein
LQDARLEVAAADEDPTDTFDTYRAAVAARDHAQDVLGCTERQAVLVGDLPGAQPVCGAGFAGTCCQVHASIVAGRQDGVSRRSVSESFVLRTTIASALATARSHVSGGETLVGWLLVVIIVLVIIGAVTVIRKVL